MKRKSASQQAAIAATAQRKALIAQGARFGVSARYILEAQRIMNEAPDLFEQVLSGELRLFQAKAELKRRKRLEELEREFPPRRRKKGS